MREIKFRQWNRSKWHYWGFDEHGCFQNPIRSQLEKYPHYYQYTGLKDKNGVEIYEGDIVKYRRSHNDEHHIAQVKYQQSYFCLWTDLGYHEMFYIDAEIIGNIYENPELLSRA